MPVIQPTYLHVKRVPCHGIEFLASCMRYRGYVMLEDIALLLRFLALRALRLGTTCIRASPAWFCSSAGARGRAAR
eukprot:3413413-Alexandrium_andersonii.AAC.1